MGTTRTVARAAVVAAASVATLFAAAAPAQAGKPGGGGSSGSGSTLQLVVLTGADSVPNWGEDVTFRISTTATASPYVDLTCKQGRTLVYSASSGFFDSYPWPWTRTMNLASQSWTGGSASCSAMLYMFGGKGKVTLATLPFTASA
jgi:hypothetical protein